MSFPLRFVPDAQKINLIMMLYYDRQWLCTPSKCGVMNLDKILIILEVSWILAINMLFKKKGKVSAQSGQEWKNCRPFRLISTTPQNTCQYQSNCRAIVKPWLIFYEIIRLTNKVNKWPAGLFCWPTILIYASLVR